VSDANQGLELGRVIGRYVVEEQLGKGTAATVYRVRHTELDTVHAMKVVREQADKGATRLEKGGRALGRIDHPGVVRVIDLLDVDGSRALVMEHVDGPTLRESISRGRLTPRDIHDIGEQLMDAIGASHNEGFVHRDLKPSNILLQAQARGRWLVKVADFDLVKQLTPDPTASTTGNLVGTPAYMAPEQAMRGGNVGPHTDLWGLGAVLYELETGRRAFGDKQLVEVLEDVMTATYERSLLKTVPYGHSLAIQAALQQDPERRPADCNAMLALWNTPEPHRDSSRWPWVLVILAALAGLGWLAATGR
jgi:eukaryotic-like serine/threonine-protein kinase